MAALRKIGGMGGSITGLSYTGLLPPALLICSRGIASKLFVGGSLFSLSFPYFFSFKIKEKLVHNTKNGNYGVTIYNAKKKKKKKKKKKG